MSTQYDTKPTPEILRKLYIEDMRSVNSIAQQFKVQYRVVWAWLLELNITVRTRLEQQQIYLATKKNKMAPSNLMNVGDSEQLMIATTLPERSEGLGPSLTPLTDDKDYDSAYLRLSKGQQTAVELLARLDAEPLALPQIAEAARVTLETLSLWRRTNLDFQTALDEAQKPQWLSELKTLSRTDLLTRFRSGVGLSKEDRVLAFKLTNDLGSEANIQSNVQVNINKGDW
jgi:hypothetical protein